MPTVSTKQYTCLELQYYEMVEVKLLIKVILTVLVVFIIPFSIIWGFHGFATKDSGNYTPPEKQERTKPKGPNEKVFADGTRGITSLMNNDTSKN